MIEQKLPLRKGVGIIVLNKQNKIFVGKRKDNPGDKWQMPQGGVDEGEDYITAMKRELLEETSKRNDVLKCTIVNEETSTTTSKSKKKKGS